MLKSQRLIYQKWLNKDYSQYYSILSNPRFCEYLPGPNEQSNEQIKRSFDFFVKSFKDQNGTEIYKVLTYDKSTVIGYCGLCYVKE